MATDSVLIVGAGPTGLNLALSLSRRGITFRIVSEAAGPGEHSRAMVVQARTLEFYKQFGFADDMVREGVIAEAAHVREGGEEGGGHEVVRVSFQDMGGGISPYPFLLAYPQDDHERFLLGQLAKGGVEVEWGAKLTDFQEEDSGIRASIAHSDGRTEEFAAAYICGCDGAHSQVRQTLGIGFPGGSYDQLFYVADAKIASGFDRDFHANLGNHILALMLPVRSTGMQRLIGLVPSEFEGRRDLTFDDIRGHVEPLLNVRVTEVNWFSTYHVHHRVADRFRVGRAFLLGDAGHIHSPAGGQGMNTGIGDAINLGWKLADVLRGRADVSLLDTYEPERISFARALVSTTDRAFTSMVAEGLRGQVTRRLLAPFAVTIVNRFGAGRHAIFRTLSQAHIHYPDSALSEGKAGDVHGGDRLPWVGQGEDNFAPLGSLDWQVHVYGKTEQQFERECEGLGLALHVFPWSEGVEKAGLKKDAMYLVRPDGYVALASATQNAAALKTYTGHVQLAFAAA